MVFEKVRRARQRLLVNDAVRYAAYALSVALVSFVILLLAGTQIISWIWLVVLPAFAAGIGCWNTWRHAPSSYRAAQIVDRNLQLADTLSTAYFFASTPQENEVRRTQWAQAERSAAQVDLRRAVPIQTPRALYATACLALLAVSLFALRYGLERRLDLRAPLASIVQDKLGYQDREQAKRDRPKPRDPKNQVPGILKDDAAPPTPGELDAAPESALDTVGVPDVDNKNPASQSASSKLGQSTDIQSEQARNQEPEGVSTDPNQQQSADGRKGPTPGKPGKQDSGQQGSGNSSENSGLLGKLRDAMSSLMNRAKPQQQGAPNAGNQAHQPGNSGQQGKQGQQPGEARNGSGKDAEASEENQDAQSAQSSSPGQSGQQPATHQPGSGIGRQDGSKDVKLAEQLAAMGKISEIIGKRSANLTGELTVEVQNSTQQLHTPYAQRDAHHSQAGAEINRDEVPAAYQAFVQQYFEQVRKQAPAAASAPHEKRHADSPKPGM